MFNKIATILLLACAASQWAYANSEPAACQAGAESFKKIILFENYSSQDVLLNFNQNSFIAKEHRHVMLVRGQPRAIELDIYCVVRGAQDGRFGIVAQKKEEGEGEEMLRLVHVKYHPNRDQRIEVLSEEQGGKLTLCPKQQQDQLLLINLKNPEESCGS